jgi:hypothetical protein
MPVAPEQGASAFLFVQLQRLAPRVISHFQNEGKERLLFGSVLCLSELNKALPLFF